MEGRAVAERTGSAISKSARQKRARRDLAPERYESFTKLFRHPAFVPAALVGLVLFMMSVAVMAFSRGRLPAAEGRVLDETRTARVEFQVEDERATERARESAALLVPRVYRLEESAARELESALRSFPTTFAAAESYEQLAPEIREPLGLTLEQFQAVRTWGGDEPLTKEWNSTVTRLMRSLFENPLISSEEFQLTLNDPATRLEIRISDRAPMWVPERSALSLGPEAASRLRELVASSGFVGEAAGLVGHRLTQVAAPLFVFDKEATDESRSSARAAVPASMISYRVGELLARRGEAVAPEVLALLKRENSEFRASLPAHTRALEWIGVLASAGVITCAFGLYLRLFYTQVASMGWRFLGLAMLVAGGAGSACLGTMIYPGWMWALSVGPIMLVTMLVAVAFEPRLAFASAAAQAALVGSALGLPMGYFAVTMAGAAVAAWKLREVRTRNDLVIASVVVSIALAGAVIAISLLVRPIISHGPELFSEIASDAISCAGVGFLAGALTLMMLPTIERLFNVTTGMTLSEWRDPKQPLLRKLQLQAPGTYNHSHTVATLAEAAAEAIGADGLHVYVGALYHDVGKMNKPDYFVENQPRGFNRHTKLSPAMSLLVIVGHVKDGMELAREYKLPRSLHGYIETHHGTTLVEYFFDQARRQAEEEDDEPAPQEVEYRYPGPRPRTKEQAILMICDAVESATRSLPDPTPSRIQGLVHALATKRLMDGQFDECELTLRDLSKIEEAVTRTLASIYHGRIAYPSARTEEDDESARTTARADRAG